MPHFDGISARVEVGEDESASGVGSKPLHVKHASGFGHDREPVAVQEPGLSGQGLSAGLQENSQVGLSLIWLGVPERVESNIKEGGVGL